MAIWLAWPINGQAAKKSKGKKSFVTCQLVMQAHEGESILSYLLSVYALEKTKPPSGGSQAVFSTPVTNKQTSQMANPNAHIHAPFLTQMTVLVANLGF